MRAIADPADIHAGPHADVLKGGERLDLALVVAVALFGLRHNAHSPGRMKGDMTPW